MSAGHKNIADKLCEKPLWLVHAEKRSKTAIEKR